MEPVIAPKVLWNCSFQWKWKWKPETEERAEGNGRCGAQQLDDNSSMNRNLFSVGLDRGKGNGNTTPSIDFISYQLLFYVFVHIFHHSVISRSFSTDVAHSSPSWRIFQDSWLPFFLVYLGFTAVFLLFSGCFWSFSTICLHFLDSSGFFRILQNLQDSFPFCRIIGNLFGYFEDPQTFFLSLFGYFQPSFHVLRDFSGSFQLLGRLFRIFQDFLWLSMTFLSSCRVIGILRPFFRIS